LNLLAYYYVSCYVKYIGVKMDLVAELGGLALGSRMKRLSTELLRDVNNIYSYVGVKFESSWFTTFYAIYQDSPLAITEIAKRLSISHAAVNQVCKALLKEGLIAEAKDKNDERRRLVRLTQKGKDLAEKLKDTWEIINETASEIILESSFDILGAIREFEKSITHKSASERAIEKIKAKQLDEVEIIDYEPKYAKYFAQLNYEWLEKYYEIEDIDRRVLDHSQKEIINKGGYIFFAKYNGEIVGTVALMKFNDEIYELTKMAVTKKYQGKQIGKKLMIAALNFAKKADIKIVYLESDTKLVPAVNMYSKMGFVSVPLTHIHVSEYKRTNIKMEMQMSDWEYKEV
jgi:DNA-binding MarR family transcriptional regulator/N-acetylglutamate synthase-like GNAT family acetyltransferase